MITAEPNYQRKAHRVDVQLFIEIDGKVYQAYDWSVSGLSVRDNKLSVASGAELPASVLLPLNDARLTLDVTLVVRRVSPGDVGFEFLNLSPKNRRILRHYIQLHVDGKLDNIEDFVAISSAPAIDTPLTGALNVNEQSTDAMVRRFKKRGRITAVLILLFLAVFAGTLFYNAVYRMETTGVVIGNDDRITANYPGVLRQVTARVGTFVAAGTPLFSLRNDEALASMSRGFRQAVAPGTSPDAEKELLVSLGESLAQNQRAYHNATLLFRQRIITRKDLENTEASYITAKTNYLRQKAVVDGMSLNVTTDAAGGGNGEPLYPMIRAVHAGQVIAVSGRQGSYVTPSDVVVILQRNDEVPKVAISLSQEAALKLHVGMPARIYVPFQDQTYPAHIASIGRSTVNTSETDTMEASLDQTLVTLSFDEPSVHLPANQRVRVWIRTFTF